MKRITLVGAGIGFLLLANQPAQAEVILPGGCRMGECWESKLIEKNILKRNHLGILYSIKLATRSWGEEFSPPKEFTQIRTDYVFCSTVKPAYIFELDGTYFAHLLNPGGDYSGYNKDDYPLYWATCHNLVGPDFFSDQITARALKWGYPLNLPSEQITLKNVFDIMNP